MTVLPSLVHRLFRFTVHTVSKSLFMLSVRITYG
jgi:hypothetical protein